MKTRGTIKKRSPTLCEIMTTRRKNQGRPTISLHLLVIRSENASREKICVSFAKKRDTWLTPAPRRNYQTHQVVQVTEEAPSQLLEKG